MALNDDLIERLLRAPFGDRALDRLIAERMGYRVSKGDFIITSNPAQMPIDLYTETVSAAAGLVLPDWYWGVDSRGAACADPSGPRDGVGMLIEVTAATPALALCVAGIQSWEHRG